MTLARRRFRRRFVAGQTEVLPWLLEEELVFGTNRILGPSFGQLRTLEQWRIEWKRWRDVILPKVVEFRPGTRPAAAYIVGELPPREVWVDVPRDRGHWYVDVLHPGGKEVRHWLGLPEPFMEPEARYLHRLGVVDDEELERHREWMAEGNPECDACAADRYVLEIALYD